MPRNAIEALDTVPQTQRGSIAVERRLGRAFDMLHDDVAAEKHLLAAERILQKSHVHYADATEARAKRQDRATADALAAIEQGSRAAPRGILVLSLQ